MEFGTTIGLGMTTGHYHRGFHATGTLTLFSALALKKFPCCYASHRAMDGLLALRANLACDAESIDRVVCKMPPGGMQVLTYPRPTTGLEAKFSLQYCLAAGVLDGKYALWTFTDAAVRRQEIESLYERIDVTEDPACRGNDPQFEKRSSGSRGLVEVEVRLRDGRSDRIRVEPGTRFARLRALMERSARQIHRLRPPVATSL